MTEATIIGRCWHCGADLAGSDFGRETNCSGCGKPTRVCRNCRWYAPSRPNQCEEPVAEPVQEKERANYCEFFEATRDTGGTGGGDADALREAAEELFKF